MRHPFGSKIRKFLSSWYPGGRGEKEECRCLLVSFSLSFMGGGAAGYSELMICKVRRLSVLTPEFSICSNSPSTSPRIPCACLVQGAVVYTWHERPRRHRPPAAMQVTLHVVTESVRVR